MSREIIVSRNRVNTFVPLTAKFKIEMFSFERSSPVKLTEKRNPDILSPEVQFARSPSFSAAYNSGTIGCSAISPRKIQLQILSLSSLLLQKLT